MSILNLVAVVVAVYVYVSTIVAAIVVVVFFLSIFDLLYRNKNSVHKTQKGVEQTERERDGQKQTNSERKRLI